jgi:hypothetical protein
VDSRAGPHGQTSFCLKSRINQFITGSTPARYIYVRTSISDKRDMTSPLTFLWLTEDVYVEVVFLYDFDFGES